jgi:uroporphyrinogen decarboxylase
MNTLPPPELDKDGLMRNLRREGTPSRVFHFEHAVDEKVRGALVEMFDLERGLDSSDPAFSMKREIAVFRFIGMELFRVWLPRASFSIQTNDWVNEHSGPIANPEDIEKYNWPDISKVDFSQLDWYEKNLPKDMGLYHTIDVGEIVRDLMGYENMCISLFERPEFVDELCRRVGEYQFSLGKTLCQYKCVAAVYGSDDYGFKTSLLWDPQTIRTRFLPWHTKYAEHAHSKGKLYLLHSCGKLDEIMDDIIDTVKADAKHSFEDVITPVTEAKKLWENRISLLGGLDVDFMTRSDEQAIRKRVRETLDICMPGGGYCLGLGNWVTSYIPPENYLVLLDEARRYQ